MPPGRLTFFTLRARLINVINRRIRNGEFTERGIARLSGISQPQVHNVLKGLRALTPDTADQLMASLNIGVLDLIDQEELISFLRSSRPASSGGTSVPARPEA
jgi:transcriptional regulator with XRE-family HTH domain